MAKSNILGNVLRGVGAGWIRHQDERKKKRTEQEQYELKNKRSVEKEQRATDKQITGEKRRNEMAIEGEARRRENAVKWGDIDYKKQQGRKAIEKKALIAEFNAMPKPPQDIMELALKDRNAAVARASQLKPVEAASALKWIKGMHLVKDKLHTNNTNPYTNEPT